MSDLLDRYRAAAAAKAIPPDALAQLLDDVRRLVDGLDGIRELAVIVPARDAATALTRPCTDADALVELLRGYLDRARSAGDLDVTMPRGLLMSAIWRLEDARGKA